MKQVIASKTITEFNFMPMFERTSFLKRLQLLEKECLNFTSDIYMHLIEILIVLLIGISDQRLQNLISPYRFLKLKLLFH